MAFISLLAMAVGGVLAIALAIVGLLEAPWQLLLLGLLTALYGLQRQVWAAERNAIAPPEVVTVDSAATGEAETSSENATRSDQELIYRGIRYRVSSTDAASGDRVSAPATGLWRGQPWRR